MCDPFFSSASARHSYAGFFFYFNLSWQAFSTRHLEWCLNSWNFDKASDKQQKLVLCSPAKEWPGNLWWHLRVLLLRLTGERFFFPTLTDTSVIGQPFARTPPLLHVVPSTIHHPDVPFTLMGAHFLYLFGHNRSEWGLVEAGDIGKRWIMPCSLTQVWNSQTNSLLQGKLCICHRTGKADVSACSSVL